MRFNLDPWHDLEAQTREAMERVLRSGFFIQGPEGEAFEREFADFLGVKHVVGVGSGTDALKIAMQCCGVAHGTEVVTPALNVGYTGLAAVALGGVPTFCEVDEHTFLMDPARLEEAVTARTRVIVPVHLYGRSASMAQIRDFAASRNLYVIEDACQAHGLMTDAGRAGTVGVAGCFSFYPTKNLGCLGEGGAIATNDDELAKRAKRLRDGGRYDRYSHVEAGHTSGLDEIQAAILRTRLPHLAARNEMRRKVAGRYRGLPVPDHHIYHLMVARHPKRDAIMDRMADMGLPALSHYPVAASRQPVFYPYRPQRHMIAEKIASELFSLPLWPHMGENDQSIVLGAIAGVVRLDELMFQS